MATQSGMGTSGTSGTSGQTRAGAGGQAGQGTSNTTYDLISVMYHALQGCDTYEQYAQDAEQQGNRDVAQFFRDAHQQNQQLAQRGQQLLIQCLQSEQGGGKGQMLQGGSGGQGQQAGGGSHGQQSSGTSGGSQGRGNR
jgi:hypothetical protein